MDNKKLKILIEAYLNDISCLPGIYPKSNLSYRYRDILDNAKRLLPDNVLYIDNIISDYEKLVRLLLEEDADLLITTSRLENHLEDILKLLSVNFPEIVETQKILENAEDKLKEAIISFENEDYSSVISKLNTGVELALKDELDIPMTIRKINTRKILDICIAHDIGPKEYLQELIKHVVEVDNKIKHQGFKPQKIDAINAISAFQGFIKRAKKYPFEVTTEIRDKIFSGI